VPERLLPVYSKLVKSHFCGHKPVFESALQIVVFLSLRIVFNSVALYHFESDFYVDLVGPRRLRPGFE